MTHDPYENPFGGSPERRAEYEYQITLDCISPLLESWDIDVRGKRVLDLGCGSGGLLLALAKSGAHGVGVDLKEERISEAQRMAGQHGVEVQFLAGDVLRMDRFAKPFDLVILSEVVEHLVDWSNVEALLCWCRENLSFLGNVYASFPPWYGPFAGHQAGWPRIRYIPWYHLMPHRIKRLLAPNQASRYIAFIQELNHLTIGAFERIVDRSGLTIVRQELYHLRPEYHFRYGIPIIRAPSVFVKVPLIREVTTMGAFYLLTNCQPQRKEMQ